MNRIFGSNYANSIAILLLCTAKALIGVDWLRGGGEEEAGGGLDAFSSKIQESLRNSGAEIFSSIQIRYDRRRAVCVASSYFYFLTQMKSPKEGRKGKEDFRMYRPAGAPFFKVQFNSQ